MVCMTLAFWLGRGRRTVGVCAEVSRALKSRTTKRRAKAQREEGFRGLIGNGSSKVFIVSKTSMNGIVPLVGLG
jgi:hypothetical protein